MKLIKSFILYLLPGLLMASCIQNEALNTEADIETCNIVEPKGGINDVYIDNRQVILYVEPDADVTHVKLEFTLTPGATIDPPSGIFRDYTTPKTYTVTSQDGQWKKEYTVGTTVMQPIPTEFNFEHFKLIGDKNKYFTFYEIIGNVEQNIWASGNGGFAIAANDKKAEDYPTIPFEGRNGKCVKLETKNTGIGVAVGMPIAAGNLFLGKFDIRNAMLRPLQATQFGANIAFVPKALTGYYKYKAGPVFTEKDNSVNPNEKDKFDIYAIVYETENGTYLDGTNQLTSPRLVSVARIKDGNRVETDEWTAFNIPFELKPGKSIDTEKLLKGEYQFSIVFSSSLYGDQFRGAVGSTLFIDDVKIETQK